MLFEQSYTFPLFNKRKICGIGLILQEFVFDAAFFFTSWLYNAQQKGFKFCYFVGKGSKAGDYSQGCFGHRRKRNRYDDRIYPFLSWQTQQNTILLKIT